MVRIENVFHRFGLIRNSYRGMPGEFQDRVRIACGSDRLCRGHPAERNFKDGKQAPHSLLSQCELLLSGLKVGAEGKAKVPPMQGISVLGKIERHDFTPASPGPNLDGCE